MWFVKLGTLTATMQKKNKSTSLECNVHLEKFLPTSKGKVKKTASMVNNGEQSLNVHFSKSGFN